MLRKSRKNFRKDENKFEKTLNKEENFRQGVDKHCLGQGWEARARNKTG